MKKKRTFLILLACLLLVLFSSCSKKESKEPPADAPKETAAEATKDSPKQEVKELIKADPDDYAWPAVAKEEDFDFDEATATLLKYKGKDKIIVLPETIQGKAVLHLGNSCFAESTEITHVKLPENLVSIQTNAFYFLEKLEKVSFPSTLEIIEPYAFFNCTSIKQLSFPASVCYIGKNTFSGFAGERISFLGECPIFGEDAFTLKNGFQGTLRVSDEEKEKFSSALGYTAVADGGCNYVDRTAKEEDLVLDSSGLLTEYKGSAPYLVLPDEVKGTKITAIADKLFFGQTSLYRLHLPASLEKVGESSFYATNLVDVEFPSTIKEIGPSAFAAGNLIDLKLPGSLEKISEKAFEGNKITLLHLPEGIKDIGSQAFIRGELKEVYLPSTLTQIGEKAFSDNGHLDYVVFAGKTMPKIDPTAFSGCPIADVDIAWDATKQQQNEAKTYFVSLGFPESLAVWRANHPNQPDYPQGGGLSYDAGSGLVTKFTGDEKEIAMYWDFTTPEGGNVAITGLADGLFKGSKIKSFYTPHSGNFVSIGKEAFAGSDLEEIHLFDSVTTLGEKAFENCKNLKSITLPESIVSIGNNAFENCVNLEKVIFLGKNPTLGTDLFKGCSKLTSLVLPEEVNLVGSLGIDPSILRFSDAISDAKLAEESAKLSYPWYSSPLREKDKDPFQRMPDNYKENPAEDFDFNASTGTIEKYNGPGGTVVIPREIGGTKVEHLGFLAFSNFTVASVARGTEKEETLLEVILPETVKTIADSAFLSCSTLKRFICYGPVETLGIRAFEECKDLEEVHFVNGLQQMGIYAFNLDASLKKAEFAGKLKVLSDGAFYGCGFSGELSLDYEEIGPNALQKCANVTVLRISDRIQSIGLGAFVEMDKLEKVYFEKVDLALIEKLDMPFPNKNPNLKIILPKTASDEEVNAMVRKLQESMYSDAASMVIRE